MAGITIRILSNVREAVKGVDDVADAVEGVSDRLHDMSKDSKQSSDKMESDFRDLSSQGELVAEALRNKFRAAYKSLRNASDEQVDAAIKKQRELADKTSEYSGEIRDEVRQNLGEGIANAARGDFEALADTIGDTLGGAVSGIGGIGFAAAAAAGAAGMGALIAALSTAEEKLTETRERGLELAQIMQSNDGKIPLTERVQELLTLLGSERLAQNPFEQVLRNFLDLGTNLEFVEMAAKDAEIPISRLIKGLSGSDVRTTKQMITAIADQIERLNQESGSVNADDWSERQSALKGVKTELEAVIKQQEIAKELSESVEFIDAQKVEERAEQSKAALEAVNEAWASRLSELSSLWQGAAADASNYFKETEEGATEFDWSSYLEDAEQTIAAADELKSRIVGLPNDIKAEAERVFASQGAVAANEYAKAYEAASAQDKQRFVNAAAANGDAAGKAQASALKAAFGAPQVDALIKVRVDRSEWDRWVPNPKTGVLMAQVPRNINLLG